MRSMSAELERKLGPAWARIVVWLRERNDLSDVAAAIRRGDYEGAVSGLVDAAERFAGELRGANHVAAQRTVEWLEGETNRLVTFDETNIRSVRAMQSMRLDAIRQVTEDQRTTIRNTIADGLARGENPYVIAKDVKLSIGLTDYQRGIVTNFRRELETGQWGKAMNRELIDGRWTKKLQRLQRDGGGLAPAEIQSMVNKYSDNWVGFRSENIARTEGLRAAHRGYDTAIKNAVDNGTVQGEEFERKWNHKKHGQNWRQFHASMNGQTVGLYEPFMSGLGNQLMYPCDPNAPIEETANCTCVVSTRMKRGRGFRVAAYRNGQPLAGSAA